MRIKEYCICGTELQPVGLTSVTCEKCSADFSVGRKIDCIELGK